MELFVSPLSFFEIENTSIYENSFESIFGFKLTTSNSKLTEFYDANFIRHFGIIDISVINNSKVKIYTVKNSIIKSTQDNINNELHRQYGMMQILSLSFWFIRDSSINVDFSLYYNQQEGVSNIVRKNIMSSNSKGLYETSIFNNAEIERAVYYMQMLLSITEITEEEKIKYDSYNNLNNSLNHNTDSFNRALRYLQIARNESFTPSKIASYISTLETLFAVSDSNTYKTPERASLFIGTSIEEKHEIFRITKDSYDVRSSYVHGSDIYKKHNKKLEKISSDLDVIVRKVVLKFITNHPELNYKGDDYVRINKYFLNLALS